MRRDLVEEKAMLLSNRDSALAKAFYQKLSEDANIEYDSDSEDTDEESGMNAVEETPIHVDSALAAELEAMTKIFGLFFLGSVEKICISPWFTFLPLSSNLISAVSGKENFSLV